MWNNISGYCTDGAPTILGTKSGFHACVNKRALIAKGIRCVIHHQTLASEILPASLEKVLDQTIQILYLVKGGALKSRLFRQLCTDTEVAHHSLLLHTNVRWLSRGNGTERVLELRYELNLFFDVQDKMELFTWLNDEKWIVRLAYLVDIFEQLNKLRPEMQGRNTNIMEFVDAKKAFMSKRENLKKKVNKKCSNV